MQISMSGPVFNSKSMTFQGVCLLDSYFFFFISRKRNDDGERINSGGLFVTDSASNAFVR